MQLAQLDPDCLTCLFSQPESAHGAPSIAPCLSHTPPPPPPPPVQHPCIDVDGNGSVDVGDVLALLAGFGGPVAALNVYDGLEHDGTVGVADLLHLLPDLGRDISSGCVDPVVGVTEDFLIPIVTASSASVEGYVTYVLSASLHHTAANVYSIEGTSAYPMEIPAAFQVATPFGADFGGVHDLVGGLAPDVQYDSWLTIGVTDGCGTGVLSSIGISFEAWSDTTSLTVDNGAVYWLSPVVAPGGDVVVAQLTVPVDSSGTVKMGMQGQTTGGGDWNVPEVSFIYPPPEATHEPPPEHPCMDLDFDGFIGVNDLLVLLAAFGQPASELHGGFSHGEVVDVVDLLNLLPDFGNEVSGRHCMEAVVGATVDYLDPVVITQSTSMQGYTTYRLVASLHDTATNLYAIEGTSAYPMQFPAAYQVAAPFGVNLGGAQPAFFAVANNAALGYAEFDSWLTVGPTDGGASDLSTIGVDFSTWTESSSLFVEDGSVFHMDPNTATGGDVTVAQLTVPSGSAGTASMGMQGHATGGGDWDVHHVFFNY
jgi:hypothetical protein